MATVYIDPTNPNTGDGSIGNPYKAWTSVTWTAGNSYLQRKNTKYTGAVTIGGSGSAGSNIVIGSYPDTEPGYAKIDGNGASTGCFYSTGRDYIEISGFELFGSTGFPGSGWLAINGGNLTITNCKIHDNQYGVKFSIENDTPKENFTITDNIVHDQWQTNISVIGGTVSGGTITTVRIYRNRCSIAGKRTANYNLHISTRISTSGAGSIFDGTRTPYDVIVEDNTFDQSTSYNCNLRYVTKLKFNRNRVTGTVFGSSTDGHSIWLGGCRNFEVLENDIFRTFGQIGAGSGTGVPIFVDQGGANAATDHESRDGIVAGNRIRDTWQGSTNNETSSTGIYVYRSYNIDIVANIIKNAMNGISVQGASTMNSYNISIYNNVLQNITNVGIGVHNLADSVSVYNNIIDTASEGIWTESGDLAATNVTHDYNCAYNCTLPFSTGEAPDFTEEAAGTNDITTDPQLRPDFSIPITSPCYQTGIKSIKVRDIKLRRILSGLPSMGVYQDGT